MGQSSWYSLPSTPPPPQTGPGNEKMQLPVYLGGDAWGSPQGQFDIPSGLVAATPGFAMVASRYMAEYDVAPETLAKVVVHERYNAQKNPKAIFRDKPVSIEDVHNFGPDYDRTLMALQATGPVLAIGLAYAAQEIPAVPRDANDRRLDWIVTEAEAIRMEP